MKNINIYLGQVLIIIFFINIGLAQQETAMIITENGDVGIGTDKPQARLYLYAPEGSNGLWIRAGDGPSDVLFHIEDSDGSLQAMHIDDSGNIGLGTTEPKHPIHLFSGAYVTRSGEWIYTGLSPDMNTKAITKEVADSVFKQLNPVMYGGGRRSYGIEGIGFIVDEMPELLAVDEENGLNPIKIIALLTKIVQQNQQKIAELDSLLKEVK